MIVNPKKLQAVIMKSKLRNQLHFIGIEIDNKQEYIDWTGEL